MQVRSATYAKEASDVFAYMTDDDAKEDYGTALYWMGLNFGTLCRIGGGGSWSAERAHEIAEKVCVCVCVRVRVRVRVQACMHACVRACVRTCVRTCV